MSRRAFIPAARQRALNTDARCRAVKTVQLSTHQDLQYDVLVLTAGLQDQTLHSIKASGVSSAVSVPELTGAFTAADTAGMTDILVYGHTLAAYDALTLLQARGVDLETVQHLAPSAAPDSAAAALHTVRPPTAHPFAVLHSEYAQACPCLVLSIPVVNSSCQFQTAVHRVIAATAAD